MDDEQIKQARTILRLRAIATTLGKFMPVQLRPHTRCFLAPQLNNKAGDTSEATALGIIFNRWPNVTGEVLIRQTAEGTTTVVREGTAMLAEDGEGNEIGLLLPERWMWHQLIAKYKGLTFGNL